MAERESPVRRFWRDTTTQVVAGLVVVAVAAIVGNWYATERLFAPLTALLKYAASGVTIPLWVSVLELSCCSLLER